MDKPVGKNFFQLLVHYFFNRNHIEILKNQIRDPILWLSGLAALSFFEILPAISFALPSVLVLTGLGLFERELRLIIFDIYRKNNFRLEQQNMVSNILLLVLYAGLAKIALDYGIALLVAAIVLRAISIVIPTILQLPVIDTLWKTISSRIPPYVSFGLVLGFAAGGMALALYFGAPLPHVDLLSNITLYLITAITTSILYRPVSALHRATAERFFSNTAPVLKEQPERPILKEATTASPKDDGLRSESPRVKI